MEKVKINWKQIGWLLFFSVAMGFLESAVVVYLRQIYYPQGFRFPLTMMEPSLVITELGRELATVIMLAGVGILAGRSPLQRLSFFLAAFATWDLFYYVFLKVLLHWPESLLTWDILFLIPVPWIGPVWTPCLISLTMLLLAAILYYRDLQHPGQRLTAREWTLLIVGSQVVIFSWTWDYLQYSSASETLSEATIRFSGYIPGAYPWWMFLLGEVLLLVAIFHFWKRTDVLTTHRPI